MNAGWLRLPLFIEVFFGNQERARFRAADWLNQKRMKTAQPITIQLLVCERLTMVIFKNLIYLNL